jgi:hypothetical protein
MASSETENRITRWKARLAAAEDALTNFKKKTAARIADASDPLGMTAMDAAGGFFALGTKAGIEVFADWIQKKKTDIGKFREPSIVSGAIAAGLGTVAYLGNMAIDLDFPLPWFRDIPKSSAFGLSLLGMKELGQAVVVWNERRQLKATDAAAQQMLQAQQQQAQLNQAAK